MSRFHDRFLLPILIAIFASLIRRRAAQRRLLFRSVPKATDRVVFLGDSITEAGTWSEWFPDLPVQNRGIGGDAIWNVRERLQESLHAPRAIALLIGTNDLHGLGKTTDPDGIAAQLRELLRELRKLHPSTPLIINSVLPRTAWFRERLKRLNEQYREIAAEFQASYVDVWPALANADGVIRKEFTDDNLHLNIEGYAAWVSALRPHLAQFASAAES